MTRLLPFPAALLLGGALLLGAVGCVTSLRRPGLAEAAAAAQRRLNSLRSVELLRDIARERQERSRMLRLGGVVAEYASAPEKFTVFSDPLLEELEFAMLYARVMLLPDDPELSRRLLPEAERQLHREQALLWSRLDGAAPEERNHLELEIMLKTGWNREKVRRFDFSTLPAPGEAETLKSVPAPAPLLVEHLIRRLYRDPSPALLDQAENIRKNLVLSRLRQARSASGARGRAERRGILIRLVP